jgi:hypothetical protein
VKLREFSPFCKEISKSSCKSILNRQLRRAFRHFKHPRELFALYGVQFSAQCGFIELEVLSRSYCSFALANAQLYANLAVPLALAKYVACKLLGSNLILCARIIRRLLGNFSRIVKQLLVFLASRAIQPRPKCSCDFQCIRGQIFLKRGVFTFVDNYGFNVFGFANRKSQLCSEP